MTKTEKAIRDQLTQELVNRAQADEKIVQLRAALSAVQSQTRDLDEDIAIVTGELHDRARSILEPDEFDDLRRADP